VPIRKQCARPGCSAVATATFTFDAREQTVWLDAPLDGNARAGELCERHARTLTPPQGWRLDDRRNGTAPTPAPAAPPTAAPAPTPAPAPPRTPTARPDILVAHSPLLSRAFEAAGNY
jgi:uncharacterized protein DUF3499